jgi:hypothetical protein
MLGSMIVLALRFMMGKAHIEDIPKMWGPLLSHPRLIILGIALRPNPGFALSYTCQSVHPMDKIVNPSLKSAFVGIDICCGQLMLVWIFLLSWGL